ncbi:PREDICTED: glycogenin-1-like isoform X2 [Cyprinodon variegatus]|uniref:glycogenin-1-like isoform X2 n=1 Tax=Cyprinodon variegatus TaxID=28743 RepID=UPI000742AB6F|nr:PREDICTED: glycogenin-1-like isoform X2 [Cyprinodon variegatus]
MSAGEAFVTLAASDSYCQGATVVATSLRRHATTRRIVAMVTPNISEQSRKGLEDVFDEVITVEAMNSEDPLHLAMLGRPELGVTFTKIHCWNLTQFSKCVFLDADTLVLSNVDELFQRDELSAAPDPGWPDCFNSGVFVFRPSRKTYESLLDHALHHGSFDGGDQGLLNSFFSSWSSEDISKHLPFLYNLCASSLYSYLPAFRQFGHQVKIVHFAGAVKPWSSQREDGHSRVLEQFESLWWKEHHHHSAPPVTPSPTPSRHRPKVQEQGVQMPFTVNLDTSSSLLAHFSTSDDSLHSQPEELTSPHRDSCPPQKESSVREEKSPHLEKESAVPNEKTAVLEERTTFREEKTPFPEENMTFPEEKTAFPEEKTTLPEEKSPVLEKESVVPEKKFQKPEPVASADLPSGAVGVKDSGVATYRDDEPREVRPAEHRRMWEAGQADYLGRDAFQNIQKMLDRFLLPQNKSSLP